MAKTEDPPQDTPPADPPDQPPLEQRVDAMEGKIDQILGILGGSGGDRLDTPPASREGQQHSGPEIAHEIRRQLDERNAKEKAAADAKTGEDRLAAVEQAVTGLAEKTPEQPVRRSTKVMWGS